MHAITEGTNAQAEMTEGEECYYAEIDGVPTVLEEKFYDAYRHNIKKPDTRAHAGAVL